MKKIMCLFLAMSALVFTGCQQEPNYEVVSTPFELSFKEASQQKNDWKLRYYVDEFGDETDKAYIQYVGNGNFSNSATKDSTLIFKFLIESNTIGIELYEYGSSLVQNIYSENMRYSVSVKDESDTKHSFTGIMNSAPGSRIYIINEKKFFALLNTPQIIKLHIVDVKYPSTYYNFSVDTSDFSEAYAKLSE